MSERFTLRAGKYLVGDPCYFVPNEKWQELLKSFGRGENPAGPNKGVYVDAGGKKVEVIAYPTSYKDGEYWDDEDRVYRVESGMIGIVLASAIPEWDRPHGGLVHECGIEEDAEAWGDGRMICFGMIEIDTNPFEGDEEEGIGNRTIFFASKGMGMIGPEGVPRRKVCGNCKNWEFEEFRNGNPSWRQGKCTVVLPKWAYRATATYQRESGDGWGPDFGTVDATVSADEDAGDCKTFEARRMK